MPHFRRKAASVSHVASAVLSDNGSFGPRKSFRRCPTPLAWFLPGPFRMRGGAARHFASGRHFHRGSQAEATWRKFGKKMSSFQWLI